MSIKTIFHKYGLLLQQTHKYRIKLSVHKKGFNILEDFLSDIELSTLNLALNNIKFDKGCGGIRNIEKKSTVIKNFIYSEKLKNLASSFTEEKPSFIRAILFNKTQDNNWSVTWHQDRTVSLSNKFESKNWGPWSEKDGVIHVQPPIEVLNKMISIRIHLDDSCKKNGCLRVVPYSHLEGIIDHSKVSEFVTLNKIEECEVKSGTAIVMSPLVLHSSMKAKEPSQRRVLHIEFTDYPLPKGVSWV